MFMLFKNRVGLQNQMQICQAEDKASRFWDFGLHFMQSLASTFYIFVFFFKLFSMSNNDLI